MCGIVGYVGEKQAAPILLDGLSKLEYRGYDSAGIAVFDGIREQVVHDLCDAKSVAQHHRVLNVKGKGQRFIVALGLRQKYADAFVQAFF